MRSILTSDFAFFPEDVLHEILTNSAVSKGLVSNQSRQNILAPALIGHLLKALHKTGFLYAEVNYERLTNSKAFKPLPLPIAHMSSRINLLTLPSTSKSSYFPFTPLLEHHDTKVSGSGTTTATSVDFKLSP